MRDVSEFIENFLAHEYDPVKAREYYLRTRKLKGRQPGKAVVKKASDPRSNKMYNGKPLKKLGQRIEEDETPDVSPTGAKLVDYDGKGLGKGIYADGSVYDPKVGWTKTTSAAVNAAKVKVDATRAKSGLPPIHGTKKAPPEKVKMNPRRRIGAAEQKLIRAKTLANRVKDPKAKAKLLRRLAVTERKLKAAQARHMLPARKGLRE